MIVSELKTSLTVSGGSATAISHRNVGGLLKYVLIRANTSTTSFYAALTDTDGTVRINYDVHTGEIVDNTSDLPLVGMYLVNITNASATDTFKVILGVWEKA